MTMKNTTNYLVPINLSFTLAMHVLWEIKQRKYFYDSNETSFSDKKRLNVYAVL